MLYMYLKAVLYQDRCMTYAICFCFNSVQLAPALRMAVLGCRANDCRARRELLQRFCKNQWRCTPAVAEKGHPAMAILR